MDKLRIPMIFRCPIEYRILMESVFSLSEDTRIMANTTVPPTPVSPGMELKLKIFAYFFEKTK